MKHVPAQLIEQDRDAALPPGGGIAFVIVGSLVFWSAMLWLVL